MISKEKVGLEKEAFDWADTGVFNLKFPESQKAAAAAGYMAGVLVEREACAKVADEYNDGDVSVDIASLIRARSDAHLEIA